MKSESEIRRRYSKLNRMNDAGHLNQLEKAKMDALEWVLHTND